MRSAFQCLAWFLCISSGVLASPLKDSCLECHKQLEDDVTKRIAEDIHFQRGISCAQCHGGDSSTDDAEKSMDAKKGYMGKPKPAQIPALCSRCHSDAAYMRNYNPAMRVDQLAEYRISVHGKRLALGDERVATCISCHSAHNIRKASDPKSPVYVRNVVQTCSRCHANEEHMKPYGIPTHQQSKYLASAHGAALFAKGDLSAPTCNDCHGNHGATPPGVSSVAAVCRQCHATQADLFDKSPHKKAFAQIGQPECVSCHGNHEIVKTADVMVGTGTGSVCLNCHKAGDAGYRVAGQTRAALDLMKSRLTASESLLDRAERAGMEVSKAKFDLNAGRDRLIRARVLVHSVTSDDMDKVTQEGLEVAARTHQAGENALIELAFRRKGLAVSLFLIVLVIAALLLRIKEIERAPNKK